MLPSIDSKPLRQAPGMKSALPIRHTIAALLLLLTAPAFGQVKPSEYDVKAAYLFNFGKFMRNSGAGEAPRRATFDICILGHDPIGHVLDDITAHELIADRAVR